MCDRWMRYETFVADVGVRPSSGLSLDRYPNPAGNYEPGNVRWATSKQQGANRRPLSVTMPEKAARIERRKRRKEEEKLAALMWEAIQCEKAEREYRERRVERIAAKRIRKQFPHFKASFVPPARRAGLGIVFEASA